MLHHAVQEHCLALEDGADMLSRNVVNRLPTCDPHHPKRAKTTIYFNHDCLKHLILCFLLMRYSIMTDIYIYICVCVCVCVLVILCQFVLNCEALKRRLSGSPFGRNHIDRVFFHQVAQSRYDVWCKYYYSRYNADPIQNKRHPLKMLQLIYWL